MELGRGYLKLISVISRQQFLGLKLAIRNTPGLACTSAALLLKCAPLCKQQWKRLWQF